MSLNSIFKGKFHVLRILCSNKIVIIIKMYILAGSTGTNVLSGAGSSFSSSLSITSVGTWEHG